MKIIRVFPKRTSHTPTDDMAFIGDPPLDRPQADEVHVSCTFTWDKLKSERLKLAWGQYYPVVRVGGVAYDDYSNGFVPGMYLREGITITSRGCNNQCPWCLAWKREGKIRELVINEGHIIQDNNLLQCRPSHIDKVFDMLRGQHQIQFTGGLEARLITQGIADRIRDLRVSQIFLACDTDNSIVPLRKALRLLDIPNTRKLRCYVLLKYDPEETKLHALIRILQVYEAGAIPFTQLYQPPDKRINYPIDWCRFTRTWQRPAGTVTAIKTMLNNNAKGSK